MNFNSSDFGFFLTAVFCLYWLLRGNRVVRYSLLLLASWFFYASWNFRYLGLILASTLLDYWVGGKLAKLDFQDERQRPRRKLLLCCSVVGNLGLLGTFKYYNFFRANIESVLDAELPFLDVLLPVGISFYTFQTLSYTIDIYRGKLKPARNLYEFGLFVAFFPQLVAGPIVRASDFLPQLENRPRLSERELSTALYRIMEGLFKKVVIADVLAVGLVDRVFDIGSEAGGLEALLGVYAYAMQIYCDFAGYSDIAIGSALLLGFRIPENFDAPYVARSIQDFWHRWHMSLSSWLRDYLYIPLGGNRLSPLRTYVNLMLTMLLGGLWHGAAWNFVAWGGLHGLWLGVNRFWSRRGLGSLEGRWGAVLSVAITFHLVCLGWVFFRAADFAAAEDLLGRIGSGGWSIPELPPSIWIALALGYSSHFLPRSAKERVQDIYVALPAVVVGFIWSLFLGLLAYSAVEGVPFIYFQF
ncbi:MAG: MBOAT family O-acyltransferase [Planctomycetota bacterium]